MGHNDTGIQMVHHHAKAHLGVPHLKNLVNFPFVHLKLLSNKNHVEITEAEFL